MPRTSAGESVARKHSPLLAPEPSAASSALRWLRPRREGDPTPCGFALRPRKLGPTQRQRSVRLLLQRTPLPRLPHQSLDDGADCGADRARVGSPLPSGSYRAVDARPELEPPKTGASGPGARRTGHRALEAEGLATEKNAAWLGAHLVSVEESGFLLIPNVVRTGALRGQTAVLRHWYRRERISVISRVSVSSPATTPRPLYHLWFDNIRQEEVCLTSPFAPTTCTSPLTSRWRLPTCIAARRFPIRNCSKVCILVFYMEFGMQDNMEIDPRDTPIQLECRLPSADWQ